MLQMLYQAAFLINRDQERQSTGRDRMRLNRIGQFSDLRRRGRVASEERDRSRLRLAQEADLHFGQPCAEETDHEHLRHFPLQRHRAQVAIDDRHLRSDARKRHQQRQEETELNGNEARCFDN